MSAELKTLVQRVSDFGAWNHAKKIKFFAWFLHSQKGHEYVTGAEIKDCYNRLHLELPSSISPFLNDMTLKRPKEALKSGRGYSLVKKVRDEFEEKYGENEITVQVTKLLSELPDRVPNLVERDFLKEALTCYRHGAFRAAIVMCWNLAYDHLLDYVLTKHLAAFNTRMPIRCPNIAKRTGITAITNRDDFTELKEHEVVEICRSANIITADVYKILDTKLGRRNTAAHPNRVKIEQPQADDFISDLVNNVVLTLN